MGGTKTLRLEQLLHLDDAKKEELGVRHTPGEIAQQPRVWQQAAQGLAAVADELAPLLEGSEELILTGAGSSYFIGECAAPALAQRLTGMRVQAVPSTQIVMNPDTLLPRRPFTLVSIARSGNSPEGNAVFHLAETLRPGLVRHIVITCNEQGELAQLARTTREPAGLLVLPPETNDRGLAMTSSFTSLVVAAMGLGYVTQTQAYQDSVSHLGEAFDGLVDKADALMASLASRPMGRAFFIGASPFYGAALESHLKVQEMTDGQVLAKAEETLGLRHGPMAGIDGSTLTVLFASSSPYRRQYERDLLKEMAAKELGAVRLVIAAQVDPTWRAYVHDVIEFDPQGRWGIDDALVSPLLVVPAQLYGLHKGMQLGLKPDAPSRGGVINRVVEGVTIYPYPGQKEAR